MGLQDLLKQAKQDELSDKSEGSLFCCILGPSGSGKSNLIGSTKLKTLQLYFSGESHGIKASKKVGGDNIIPFCLDYTNNKSLTSDETLARLREVLTNAEELSKEGFEVIALDGLSELDLCITQTKELKKQCLTSSGKLDGFRVPGVAKEIAHGLIKKLLNIQMKTGIHILTTCILDVKEYGENNEIIDSSPRLSTYSLAEGLLQMHPDRVIVGPQIKDDGEKVFVLDSQSVIGRISKDDKGKVKKMFNFSPRLSSGELPKLMKADLAELIVIKRKV